METKNSYHIQFLNAEFNRRMKRNSHYSLRSFARDLSITSSWLSEVLNGKKGISPEKAQSLCHELGLSTTECRLFQLSVKAAHSRKKEVKAKAISELIEMEKAKGSLQLLTNEEFQPLSEWYYLALLELCELPECRHTVEWFSKKLNLPVVLIRSSLKLLVDKGHLRYSDGKFMATHAETSTQFDVPSDSIKKYHQQMMDIASRALLEQSVLQRDFLNMTFAFDSSRAEEAQKVLRKFQQEFAQEFYPTEDRDKDSVYQLTLQFFRLDRKGE